jgi:hypothetical protein
MKDDKDDVEIEEFRISLLKSSEKACMVKKIKPILNSEWIRSLS